MIIYQGVKVKNKVSFICFSNDEDERVEVPVETLAAQRIVRYLERIAKSPKELVEREDEED